VFTIRKANLSNSISLQNQHYSTELGNEGGAWLLEGENRVEVTKDTN